jgi:hypothetical protein
MYPGQPSSGLKVPASTPFTSQETDLNPEGNVLNPDLDALNLASTDEVAWQLFGDDLLPSDEDELALDQPSVQHGATNRTTTSAFSAAQSTLALLGQTIQDPVGGARFPWSRQT